MQEIKLTHIYPIITPSQDNCVRVNSIQNVCEQPFVRMSVGDRLFECLWVTVCSNVCGQPFVRMSVGDRLFECLWTTVCSNVCE